MAGRVPREPRVVPGIATPQVEDEATNRGLVALTDATKKLQTARQRTVTTVDLVIGTNLVQHGLSRPVIGYSITPTVASAAFAHAIDATNPRPDLEVWIVVVGTDQPRARIEIW